MSSNNFLSKLYAAHRDAASIPSPKQVCAWIDGLLQLLFPEFSDIKYVDQRQFEHDFEHNRMQLHAILKALTGELGDGLKETEDRFFEELEGIRALLLTDANAILMGDPAAVDLTEVIRSYPGFYAIAVYRIAHAFYQLKVPLIPRILSEHAHTKTGVDIHPGARIAEAFCIDHGTGVVIGETSDIGKGVKIYQGVTLGALSVQKEFAQTKRHPTIEEGVVIYAGATILGGDTIIGKSSIIGGNVWVIKSVEPKSRIYFRN